MRGHRVLGSRLSALAVALLGAGVLAFPTPASTQVAGVSCFVPPAKLSDGLVAKFTANPTSLLAEYPTGGPTLMSAARRLAGSDVRTVDALIDIASKAVPDIKADIAAGLANTVATCVWTRPDIARSIQEKMDASNDLPLVTAFRSVLRAIGSASLGGTGGPGADIARTTRTTASPSGAEPTGSPSQTGTVDRLSFGRRGVGASGSENTGGSTSIPAEGSTSVGRFNGNRLFRPEAPVSPTMQ